MSEALLQYITGFQDGAIGKPYPKPEGDYPTEYHPEYLKGHGDGTKTWNEALALLSKIYPLFAKKSDMKDYWKALYKIIGV